MRVGLLTYGSVETITGGYLHDRRLRDHLVLQGDEVEVVSLPVGTYARHFADNLSRPLARRLASADFDVLLQDELCHPSLVLLNRWLRGRAGYPTVAVVHVLRSSERGMSRLKPIYAAGERAYLATVDGVVCNSKATRATVEDLVGRSLPGVIAYPGGDHIQGQISDGDVAKRARAAGPLRVLSVANVVPGKGLHVLVSALAGLPVGSWHLRVAGSLTMDRPYAETIRRQVRDLGRDADVEFLGAVPSGAITEHLGWGQVMAVPSAYEAFGIAYLEAMRFGLPVIATSAGGPGEIVDDGQEGFLVAPGDVAGVARALRALDGDRELLLRMGLTARRRAESHTTWAESCELARDLLCSLAGARNRASQ